MKSIIQNEKKCYFCGTTYGLHKHHIFGGSNRKWSEKYGLFVYICGYHHNLGGLGKCVHQSKEMDLILKQKGQVAFECTYPDLDFKKIFGKNYY